MPSGDIEGEPRILAHRRQRDSLRCAGRERAGDIRRERLCKRHGRYPTRRHGHRIDPGLRQVSQWDFAATRARAVAVGGARVSRARDAHRCVGDRTRGKGNAREGERQVLSRSCRESEIAVLAWRWGRKGAATTRARRGKRSAVLRFERHLQGRRGGRRRYQRHDIGSRRQIGQVECGTRCDLAGGKGSILLIESRDVNAVRRAGRCGRKIADVECQRLRCLAGHRKGQRCALTGLTQGQVEWRADRQRAGDIPRQIRGCTEGGLGLGPQCRGIGSGHRQRRYMQYAR